MANVDPFIQPIPQTLSSDPVARAYFEYLHRFLHDLWVRTGGGDDIINNTTIEEKYAWDLTTNFAREQDLTLPQVQTSQERQFNAVTITSNYTSVDYDFINAKSRAIITLPKYPEENAVVIIRNGDGSQVELNGNGRLINGQSTGKIYRKGTALTLQYFIDDDEWFAR